MRSNTPTAILAAFITNDDEAKEITALLNHNQKLREEVANKTSLFIKVCADGVCTATNLLAMQFCFPEEITESNKLQLGFTLSLISYVVLWFGEQLGIWISERCQSEQQMTGLKLANYARNEAGKFLQDLAHENRLLQRYCKCAGTEFGFMKGCMAISSSLGLVPPAIKANGFFSTIKSRVFEAGEFFRPIFS